MSTYRAVKSLGQPYFAFISQSLQANSQQLPEDGVTTLVVQAALYSLPKQLATNDECHPLFAFGDLGKSPPAANVMALGISPSGRVVGTTMFGDVVLSPDGTIAPDGSWHTLQLAYDHGGQILSLSVDSNQAQYVIGTASNSPALPTKQGVVLMFNGTDGITRMRAAIRSATMSFYSTLLGGNADVSYAVADPAAATLVAVITGAPWTAIGQNAASWGLTPAWLNPTLYALPWGAVPNASAYPAFAWDIITPYTKRVMPTTQYRKVVAKT